MAKYEFVRGGNETVVWNPKKDKLLCEFVQGLYSTDDSDIAKTLRGLGYKEKRDYPDGAPEGGFTPKKSLLLPPKMELSPGGPATPARRPDMEVPEAEAEVVKIVTDQNAKTGKKKTLTKKK